MSEGKDGTSCCHCVFALDVNFHSSIWCCRLFTYRHPRHTQSPVWVHTHAHTPTYTCVYTHIHTRVHMHTTSGLACHLQQAMHLCVFTFSLSLTLSHKHHTHTHMYTNNHPCNAPSPAGNSKGIKGHQNSACKLDRFKLGASRLRLHVSLASGPPPPPSESVHVILSCH